MRLAIYKPYPYYKVKTRIFATLQAVYLFPQILKTDFRRDRRKSVFACWWLPPPTPFSQNFILRLRTVPALFLPPPAEIFCKRRSWLTSIIANCPAKGSGIFSKNLSGSQNRSQRETLFKGIGMLPNKQNLRFSASPEIVVLSVCIYKRPACPVAHGCCFRPPSTKISAKALTGTSVCATIMGN